MVGVSVHLVFWKACWVEGERTTSPSACHCLHLPHQRSCSPHPNENLRPLQSSGGAGSLRDLFPKPGGGELRHILGSKQDMASTCKQMSQQKHELQAGAPGTF